MNRAKVIAGTFKPEPTELPDQGKEELALHFSEQAALARTLRALTQAELDRANQQIQTLADTNNQLLARVNEIQGKYQGAIARAEIAEALANERNKPADTTIQARLEEALAAKAKAEGEAAALRIALAAKPAPIQPQALAPKPVKLRAIVRERDGNGRALVYDIGGE